MTTEKKKTSEKNNTNKRMTPFTDKELEFFRALIIKKRQEAMDEIERWRSYLSNDTREELDTDSGYSYHLADSASVGTDREHAYMMVERQQKLIGYLNRALERIDNKTYGICRVTGKPINRERLEAIPHTEISIEAKLKNQR
ncbi:MAG TPA: TraR/DksA C4-type zinc finger protein [bacterium]|nr:TraR/DksA C4-type zinc finger protein [bacterium]HPN43559.1 TraR/DksA C4-type zinc finger protein [bacterium]